MKKILMVLALVAVVQLGCWFYFHQRMPAPEFQKQKMNEVEILENIEIVSNLGVPVGRFMTIKGYKEKGNPKNPCGFVVTDVNGRKIDERIIEVSGIPAWPAGTEATLSGVEVGTLHHVYRIMTSRDTDHPDIFPYQSLDLRFHVSEVVAPANLHLSDYHGYQALPPEEYLRDEK